MYELKAAFDPYKPYGFTNCCDSFAQITRDLYEFTSPLMRYNFTIVYGLKTVFYNLPNCMDCKVVVLNCIRLSILDMTEHTHKLVTIKPATTCTIETWCLSHYVILNLCKISRRRVCLSELWRDLNQI